VPSRYIKRSVLPALERNILKYRALEMVMILFYVERLKTFVCESIQATDAISEVEHRLPKNTKNIYRKAWAILVRDGILTEAEKNEIERIVDYRNEIAHRIHELTYDLGQTRIAHDYRRFYGVKYQDGALKRLKHYREKIERDFISKYVISLSFDELLFEPAEKTYEEELSRLHRKITRQITNRRAVQSAARPPEEG
jgi:uncharacterized protein YutE (UPF0331/DUF86 family)